MTNLTTFRPILLLASLLLASAPGVAPAQESAPLTPEEVRLYTTIDALLAPIIFGDGAVPEHQEEYMRYARKHPELNLSEAAVRVEERRRRRAGRGDDGAGRPADSPDRAAADLLELVNRERALHCPYPVALDPRLCAAARDRAADCARSGSTDPGGPALRERLDGVGYPYAAEPPHAAEIVVAGHPDAVAVYTVGASFTPAHAFSELMRTPGDWTEIVGDYRHFGGAMETSGETGARYFVVILASPR